MISDQGSVRELMILSTPIALKNILEHLSAWVNLICIGHAGSATVLGAAAFASSVNQLVGVSVAVALGRAVSTASSQAAGRSDHEALGLVLERALPLACAMALPIMALLCILPLFVRLLGMGEQFATLAGEYAIAILPVTAARGVCEVLQAWLACQKITKPPLYINLALTPFHAAVCYSLVFNTRLGFLGAGCANSAMWIARAATLYMYCISPHADLDRPFGGLTRRGLRDGRGELLRLVLPGVLMSDYWTGEAIMVCTGLVPNPAVAVSALSVYTCATIPSPVRYIAATSHIPALYPQLDVEDDLRRAERGSKWGHCLCRKSSGGWASQPRLSCDTKWPPSARVLAAIAPLRGLRL